MGNPFHLGRWSMPADSIIVRCSTRPSGLDDRNGLGLCAYQPCCRARAGDTLTTCLAQQKQLPPSNSQVKRRTS